MFDWRILAASFAAIFAVSFLLTGGLDHGVFSHILEKANEWLKELPVTGFFSSAKHPSKDVGISVYGKNLKLLPDSGLNITINDVNIRNFHGSIMLRGERIKLSCSGKTEIEFPVNNLTVHEINVGKTIFRDVDFEIDTQGLTITAKNSSIEITDFSGTVSFEKNCIKFRGNVSAVKGNGKLIV